MASLLVQQLIDDGFRKLSGLKISGTVPLQQDLINQALDELVRNWSDPREKEASGIPATQFLTLVRKVQVRAEQGAINVDFDIGV